MLPAVSLLKMCAAPGCQIYDRTGRSKVEHLCESGQQFLLHQVSDFISRHGSQQCVVGIYSSDGSPMLLNRAWTRLLGKRVITRKAKSAQGYLVDRCYYFGRSAEGQVSTSVMFRDSFSMTQGKKGWNIMAACMHSGPLLRSLGFAGPAISRYVCWQRLLQLHA